MQQAFEDKSLAELKDLCKERELKVSGTKAELIQRLQAHERGLRVKLYSNLDKLDAKELKALAEKLRVEFKASATKAQIYELLSQSLKVEVGAMSDDELAEWGGGKDGSREERISAVVKRVCSSAGVDMDHTLIDQAVTSHPSIKVASWNMCNVTNDSRNKNYDKLCEILSQFDVIAVQEVLKEDSLAFLKEKLPDYEYVMSKQAVGRVRKELYAYVYRKSTVKCVQSGIFDDSAQDLFEREPFVATFKAIRAKAKKVFDFTLATIHVLYGNSKKDRHAEIQGLATVARRVLEANGAEKDLIILGDFNMEPGDESFQPLKDVGFDPLFHPPVKTTVGDVSLFDNMFLQVKVTGGNFLRRGVIEFDKGMETQVARNTISDHRPVWAEFRTDIDLDEDAYGSFDSLKI